MFIDPVNKFVTDPTYLRERIGHLERFKNTTFTVGYTAGAFDLFHKGHMHLLKEAGKHCDYLVVSVNADEHVRQRKGESRPVWTRDERAYAVGNMGVVDAVLLCPPQFFPEERKFHTSPDEYRSLKPDVAFFGSDYTPETIPEYRRNYAPKLVFIGQDMGVHTSQTLARIVAIKPSP
jgi:D-beta-D-heptose 7-phosphate kinase/D-beta-D-heptose 1-phosphate adenosyltransferase